MKKLKKEFKQICNYLIRQTEEDFKADDCGAVHFDKTSAEFYTLGAYSDQGCFLITVNDDDFDGFTDEHKLTVWENQKEEDRDHPATVKSVEQACDCKIKFNAQSEREEVIFNKRKPGPKPKAAQEKARPRNLSFPLDINRFFDETQLPISRFIQKLIKESGKYKRFYNIK